jgi:DNA (cytosine-5)-methyltransferase 1
MIHLGDICGINGALIEPVDIMTFGSPCQDLSNANAQGKGLAGSRSGLFTEAIRIVKEMREATNGRYPTFVVWENVCGAFTKNGGRDFREVITQVAKIKNPRFYADMPADGRWAAAGEYRSDEFSIAYRVYNAQYWGTPQRRRRVFLIADFGGDRAGKIQFERESLCRFTPQERGEITCAGAERGIITASGFNGHKSIKGNICYKAERSPCIETKMPPNVLMKRVIGGFYYHMGKNALGIGFEKDVAPTIKTKGQTAVATKYIYDNHAQSNEIREVKDVMPTVTATYGTGGNNTPLVVEAATIEQRTEYLIRRLMPIECGRLQGFPDNWVDDLETPDPTEAEIDYWQAVFETERIATKSKKKPKTRKEIRKWLQSPNSDSAEYRLWGNSLAIPCAYNVLAGIAEELRLSATSGRKRR